MIKVKMNWYPDYWTKEERELLFKFWRERYSKTIINMSPTGKPSGGLGFFDAEWQSYKYKTFKPVYIDSHVVNENYNKRRNSLLKEQKESQPADRYRIQLLLEAEKKSWEWWKQVNLFKAKSGDLTKFIEFSQDRNLFFEMSYKEAFSQLIEYDRECGFALADPDRDLKKNPLTIIEYRNWLERPGRSIEKGSEDDLILENIWSGINNAEELPKLKENFIPEILEEYHRNQERSDRHNGVKRSMSGDILNGQQINNRKNKVDFESTGDLNEDIKKFREKYGIVRVEKEEAQVVENKIDVDVNKFDKELENQLKDIVFHFSEKKEDRDSGFPIEKNSDIVFPPLPKENPYGSITDLTLMEKEFEEEKDFLSLDEINKLIEEKNNKVEQPSKEDIKNNIENLEEEKSSDSASESENIMPSWEEKDEEQPNIIKKSISTKEKIKRVKRKNRKIFDRNKQLKQIKKAWVALPVKEEKDFWIATKEKVKDFKFVTKDLWNNRIKHLLSIDIPEQKTLLKIKTLEFTAIKNKVLKKRGVENREVFDNVKKVSLISPKLKRNR